MVDRQTWSVIIRTGALGDFVLTLPLIKYLKEQNRSVCLFSKSHYQSIIPEACKLDLFFDIESRTLLNLMIPNVRCSVDDCYDFLNGADVYVFFTYDSILESNLNQFGCNLFWLNSRPMTLPHVTKQFFIDSGLEFDDEFLSQPVDDRFDPECRDLWIHPGSGSQTKNVSADIFAQLAQYWQTRNNGRIHVSFGEADQLLIPAVEDAFARKHLAFNKLNLPSLLELKRALLASAGWFIGNDSGVSHLAASLGIPVSVLFRTTDPRIWHPVGRSRNVIVPNDLQVLRESTIATIFNGPLASVEFVE